jgi:hypothetical protein
VTPAWEWWGALVLFILGVFSLLMIILAILREQARQEREGQ